ncbi:hypothetical protein M409DRAFT_24903 [Zasmidium cellare ATCC 36951]|uniref:RRM domain-containing protein n=1 Tax=Zasmidium cellare ATCC 36951 TaxID=1080233 RepID=A0A6A6CGD4_ZASCE|nr:uncharacterized protein M409DRAFT_24903 [Zasmidium cellare ATCC 36951]KAF2165002.1 hypothetical protein M409DRAFT_24903 [Zasmidium cellare ATCC 36951]
MAGEDNPPNATLYVNNLNESFKQPFVVEQLREIFGEFGEIIEIVAKKNYWARGQAFIVFSSAEEAADALEALNEFEVLGKPLHVAYAKTRSDATVKREDDEAGFEQHKKHRMAEKERKQEQRLAQANAKSGKRAAPDAITERPVKASKPGGTTAGAMADEYLPPNKVLLLRDLPEDYGKEQIQAIFQRYPGFKEVRTVPGRKGIAFAEYEDETGAIAAKEAMNGVTLGENTIRVTYQKQ